MASYSVENHTLDQLMSMPIKDALGVEIEVGQKVIYNFSGELACGVVKKIEKKYKEFGGWYYWRGYILIHNDKKQGKNQVSKVKRGTSIVVVKKFPWEE